MLTASVETIQKITAGEILVGDPLTVGNDLVIDSRAAAPGCVFVALPGERVDGHDFLGEALQAGARALIVTRSPAELAPVLASAQDRGAAVIRVPDALDALQELAAWHRSRLHAMVVGITGSTGKTTTKDFLTSVLSVRWRVTASAGNKNNELGLPLSVLAAGSDTDVLIVEMGMRGLGQIARLAEIARPDFGLVTNVGTSHIELLGSQEAVAAAKGELVHAIAENGTVFLNGDDGYSARLAERAVASIVTYGLTQQCDVRASDIVSDELSRPTFALESPQGDVSVSLGIPGRHNVYNALAAAAVGLHMGLTPDEVRDGLERAAITDMRMQVFSSASGVTVVNDAYNANPTSMRAALDALSEMQTEGRRIAVLGDMAELGSLSELAHFQLGEDVARHRFGGLVTVGERARRIADGALAEGMPQESVRPCLGAEEASEVLDDLLEPGDVVLVKASRVMGLERIVEGIVNPRVG